jgi:hypothetical protein
VRREDVLGELLDLVQRRDLREEHQHVDRVGVRGDLLGDLRGGPMVDQVAGLRPELAVVAQDVMGALVERCLRVVTDRDVREAGVALMTEVRGASNEKAKRELGWTLRYPSWRQGFPEAYRSLRAAA